MLTGLLFASRRPAPQAWCCRRLLHRRWAASLSDPGPRPKASSRWPPRPARTSLWACSRLGHLRVRSAWALTTRGPVASRPARAGRGERSRLAHALQNSGAAGRQWAQCAPQASALRRASRRWPSGRAAPDARGCRRKLHRKQTRRRKEGQEHKQTFE